jgi:hypothetical protein
MDHKARPMLFWRDIPQFLQSKAINLGAQSASSEK